MTLTIPFETIKLDMFEVSETWNKNINQILKFIVEKGNCTFEVPHDDTIYRVRKKNEDVFIVQADHGDTPGVTETDYEPIDFLNWIYAKAPYIAMVGYSRV